MSDPEGSFERRTPPTDPPAALQRRSWLAIASVSMGSVALLTSCVGLGVSGLLAAFLGMIALDRIRREAPLLRGRVLAWTGIGLGLTAFVLSALVAWGVQSLQKEWHGDLNRALAQTFAIATPSAVPAGGDAGAGVGDDTAASTTSPADALKSWIGREGSTVTSKQLEAFAEETRTRYGRYLGFRELSQEREGGFQSVQRVVVTVEFDFESGARLGSMGFCLITDTRSLLPEPRLDSIAILDAERGTLAIPARANADDETSTIPTSEPTSEPTSTSSSTSPPGTDPDAAASGTSPPATPPPASESTL